MKSKIVLISEGLIQDSRTHNISALNIIEQFNVKSFPVFVPQLYFFAMIEREEGDADTANLVLNVTINDDRILSNPTELNFQESKRNRQLVSIGGLAIPGPGILKFELTHEENTLCSYEAEVIQEGGAEAHQV